MVIRALVCTASIAVVAATSYYFADLYQSRAAETVASDLRLKCNWLLSVAHTRQWTAKEISEVGECVASGRMTEKQMKDAVAAMPEREFIIEHSND